MARTRIVATMAALLAVAVLGAPAAAGEGPFTARLDYEVTAASCADLVFDNGGVEVTRVGIDADRCGLELTLPHDHGVYALVRASLDPICDMYGHCTTPEWTRWYHSDGTVPGTVEMSHIRSWGTALIYRGELVARTNRGPGVALLAAGPTSGRTIKRFSKAHAIIRLRVSGDLLRFTTLAGEVRKHWVSDGTRKGTHVVKR